MTAVRFGATHPSAHPRDGEQEHTANVLPMERSVLVTGGVGGLGEAVVEVLRDQNWRVVAPVRAGSTGRLPENVVEITADLSAPEDVRAAVAVAAGEPGAPLRAVVNLVGGYAGGG